MSGRHNFSDLTKEFAPERRERIEARVAESFGRTSPCMKDPGRKRNAPESD